MQNLNEILGYALCAAAVAALAAIKRHLDLKRLGERKCTCPVCGAVHRDNRSDTSPPNQTEKR